MMPNTRVPAAAPGLPSSLPRRSFLGGLVGLPLVGGAVTLIGQPTASAEPVTADLHKRYVTWLAHEHRAALVEMRDPRVARVEPWAMADIARDAPMYWFPEAPDIEMAAYATRPSTRAAIVLSAVGCDWRRDGR